MANAVVKSDKYPEFKQRYRRLKARRGHKKAIIAICRMFLTAIWNILTKVEPYSAREFTENIPTNQDKIISKSQALNLLRLRGYIIKDDIISTAPA